MEDVEKIINGLESLYKSMHLNQCYACSHEFIETANEFGTEILADAINILKEQQIVRCKDCIHGELLFPDYVSCKISEENESGCHASHKPDWFCADGEKRI